MGMFLGAWPMCCSDHVQPYILTALAVYTRSPAAFEALRSFKLLQLPSVRTLKDYIDGNLEGAGECITRLEKERRVYLAMIEQKQQEFTHKQGTQVKIPCKITNENHT
jgi:hypothetical protein